MASVLAASGQNILGAGRFNISKNTITVNTDIEKLIKAEVFKKQIRIREFFYDFDRLRKGVVTEDKFRSALSMLGMHLYEKDILSLINKYKSGPDQVKYTDFCDQIDAQFFDYNLAKENLESTKSSSQISQNESAIIQQILLSIKQEIRTRRILLKQPFQDFDRTRCSHITVDQFSRVLTQLSILPNEHLFNLLIRRYIDNGNPKEVNYVKFCDDVDNVSEMLETVIKGIKPNEKIFDPNEDIVEDTKDLKLMSTLFTSKKLNFGNKQLNDVIVKIQAEVVMKRIRIREFFKDYDNLRKGVVSEQQFRRVLDVSNIKLSEQDINLLLSEFKVDNIPNGQVRYSDFCEVIDEIFTKKAIDKDPLATVTQFQPETTLPARRYYLNLSEEEKDKLRHLLNLYHKEIQNKRVLIKPHFEDFDKTKQGYISKNQFLRILNQFSLFPSEEALNLILKRYTDKGTLDEVNYYEFCRDVDIYDEGVLVSKTYADSFKNYQKPEKEFQPFIHNDIPNDIEDLLAKLRAKVKEQRLRISEFLRDFDKLRSGNITKEQLRLGLSMAKLPLSDAEFNLIIENFASAQKENNVRWKDFCDQIDSVFTQKNLEKKSATLPVFNPTTEYKYGRRGLTEQERRIAEHMKARFRQFCQATRIDIKQFFQDWDRNGRNKVTPKQFRQVLTTVNFNISDPEFNAISRMYSSEDEHDVRYVDFIRDTKVYEQHLWSSNQTKDFGAHGLDTRKRPVDANVLLEEIKNIIKINRLRVGEYFADYDPLRKGVIPTNKFRGVISQMKIDLDEEQILKLENMYILQSDPTKLDYASFLEDVNIVFTKTGLEKDPIAKPVPFEKKNAIDPRDVLTPQEEEDLHVLLLRLGEVISKHRIMFKTHFQDKDIAKSGKVSFTRFRSILDLHKLPLNDQQFKLLCKRFAHQGVEFNYIEFDEVVKKYENLYS
ncbi:hypothetical protein ABPG74_010472 [Tetrahymena malaccensis]